MYFKLRDKKDVSSVLLIHQCYDRRMVLSTGLKAKASNWDSEAQRSKGRKTEDRSLNAQLDHIKAVCNEVLIRYRLDSVKPSAANLKQAIEVALGVRSPEKSATLLGLYEAYRPYSPESALRILDFAIAKTKAFLGEGKDLEAKDVTLEWLDDFWNYLAKEGLAHNSAVAVFGALKRAMRYGLRYSLHESAIFLEFKLTQKKSDSVYLNEDEVKELYRREAQERTRLVVDMFVLQCETGLRYSDLKQLAPHNFSTSKSKEGDTLRVLTKKTQKTKETVVIPLSALAIEIVDRYDFATLNVPSLSSYLELLQKACRAIPCLGVEATLKHRGKIMTAPKWRFITSHTARRSFATNAYLAGVPTGLVMKLTGHSTEGSFMRYIKASNVESAMRVADHEYFRSKRQRGSEDTN